MKLKKIIITLLLNFLIVNASLSQSWSKLTTTGSIPARVNASSIYISTQHKLVVFGGITNNGYVNDLWSLDLNSNQWSNIPYNSTVNPIPRSTHTCMYDSLTNRLLLWSGDAGFLLNDVWAFNFSDSTWQQLFVDGNVTGAPLKRYGHAAVFDPLNRRVVSFAGFTTSGRFDDTWSFSVDSLIWNDVTNSYSPLRRCLTSASISEDRREMIVFGGQSTGNLNDIWTLNLDNHSWVNMTPMSNPPARHFASMSYCKNGYVAMFGGNNLNQGNTNGAINDFWTFSMNNQRWDTLPQNGYKPEPRYGHEAIYISSQDKLILFGGQGISSKFNDTWVYSGISTIATSINTNKKEVKSLRCNPNPSNGNFNISFFNAEEQLVKISLYDITGKEIKTLMHSNVIIGNHTFEFHENLEAGIYFCHVALHTTSEFIKVIIAK